MISIDPGTTQSAILCWKEGYVIWARILENRGVVELLEGLDEAVYCEMIASYGMPVGKEVFETCLWIGEFRHAVQSSGGSFHIVYRRDVKMHHCANMRAKDSNIRQALLDKYGKEVTRPLKRDLWSAFAIATFVTEKEKASNEVKHI